DVPEPRTPARAPEEAAAALGALQAATAAARDAAHETVAAMEHDSERITAQDDHEGGTAR
ncbi:hypothetical protein GA0115233_107043, partial [Streptomyces sp. DI166]